MNIKEFKKIVYQEKENDIKKIPLNFYNDSFKYIYSLKEKLKEVNVPMYNILNDELLSIQRDINTIFNRRTEKIILRCISEVLFASSKNTFKDEFEKLLPIEKNFYLELVNNINKLKKELINNNIYFNQNIVNNNKLTYSIVRILKDIPKFIGNDNRIYNLFIGDIVTLPSSNAKILISNNVAIYIKNNN